MQTKPITESKGKYRWTYEMSLFKNPNIFLLVAKVLLGVVWGMGILLMLPINISTHGWKDGFLEWGKVMLIMTGGFLVLIVLGYLLYAAIMGGKYIVDFTMDEKELVHAQSAKQAKKAKTLGEITAVAGALSGRPSVAGAGLNSTRTVSTTTFADVRKVIVLRRRHVIKIHSVPKLFEGGANEAYADGADFDFVCNYIRAHVPSDVKWVEK